jgi:deoxypyrimidine-specific 5' nucleotidase type C protein (NT5C)
MSLRIAFDMDGVIADFATPFMRMESRLFGGEVGHSPEHPEEEEERESRSLSEVRRRRDLVWQEIRRTPDFWTTLKPLSEKSIRRIRALTITHHWEVFFVTQRPSTIGESVQRQTQRWLVEHGFDLPSVLPIAGPRGAAAAAFRLDYHVDDSMQHCLDVIADSKAKAILISPDKRESAILSARKLGIAVANGIDQALDILEQATLAQTNPTLLRRLAALVGWK